MNDKCEIENHPAFFLVQEFWARADNSKLAAFMLGFSAGSHPLISVHDDIQFLINVAMQKRDDDNVRFQQMV